MGNGDSTFLIAFAPENWGTLERFQHFCDGTYVFDADTKHALSGAANHFHKARILLELARQHAPKLEEDEAQLERCGYTPAERGKELAALIESVLLELYSSVDCTRKVVTFIYRNERGVKQSTRKFFQATAEGNVAETVPAQIRQAFAEATWYKDFRRVRDALTHSDIGWCHLDKKSRKAAYMNSALGSATKALVIDDIFVHANLLVTHVNQFMGKVFHCLNRTLKDDEVWQMCGTFRCRLYSRLVRPSEAKDFNGGRCDAFKWFEKDASWACPRRATCGAYSRRNGEQHK